MFFFFISKFIISFSDELVFANTQETIGTSYMESDMFLAAPTNLEAHVDSQENMILMVRSQLVTAGIPILPVRWYQHNCSHDWTKV